jgi:hypothetical protein
MSTAVIVALATGSALAPAALAAHAPKVRGPISDPRHSVGRNTSTNWSGYDVTGAGATSVTGTWTQPAATCAAGENSWSSPWVGIDGDTSSTVEQIGTDSDCQNGQPTYYAWYEMYPKQLVELAMTVAPNHSYTGKVTAGASGRYVLTLTDNTTRATVTTTQTAKRARNASVEWIMEGPSTGLLTNFGRVTFTGAAAAINGQSGALGALTGAQAITMVTTKDVVRAQPSPIRSSSSFDVTWQHP